MIIFKVPMENKLERLSLSQLYANFSRLFCKRLTIFFKRGSSPSVQTIKIPF